jgi:hypothetical protein
MALFVRDVAAPMLMTEIDKRLVIYKDALNISASIPDLAWNGKTINFPVYSRVAVADAVADKGAVVSTEVDGTNSTAAIAHIAAAVKYHKDTLRQAGGAIVQNMALNDLADAMALKLDADAMAAAIDGATLKAACAAADHITEDEIEKGFARFGDKQNANEFKGIYISSKLFPDVLKMNGFSSTGLTYTSDNNGIVSGQVVGFWRGVPIKLTDNGNTVDGECVTVILKKNGLGVARKNGVEFAENYDANTFYTDVVADTYAAEKVLDDTKVAIIRKTIA